MLRILILLLLPLFAHANEQLADLEAARENYVLRSQAFSHKARTQALQLIDQAKPRAGAMSKAEFLTLLSRISALADNGHDTMFAAGWSPAQRLPLRTTWFDDGLFITRAAPEQADLLGARILAVDGKPLSALMRTMKSATGGPENYVRWAGAWFYEYPELLHALGYGRAPDRLHLRLQTRDGKTVERDIGVIDKAGVPRGLVSAMLSQSLQPVEQSGKWQVASAADPLYLQEPDQWFRARELPELQALYLQFRANFDRDGKSLVAFSDTWRKAIAAKPPHNVILDQRFNTGGNSDLTMDLMRELARAATGKIYILTSQYTFSAGIVSSALVKRHAGAKAVVVGSPIGDRLRWWSEGLDACLPNSKQCFRATNGLWDLQNGCAGENACYGDKFDAKVDSLAPQIQVAFRGKDWLAGRDAVMEAVAADIGRRR